MTEFENRNAVVIGGTHGIGQSTVALLASRGAAVAVGARNPDRLKNVEAFLKSSGCRYYAGTCDVRDQLSMDNFVRRSAEALGGVDILIDCASSFAISDDDEGWENALQVDLLGTVRAVRAALPYLRKSSSAAVVTVSSVSVRQGHPDRLPYSAAKAAVEQYTRGAANLYAADKIRVNCVAPGSTFVPGGLWEYASQHHPEIYKSAVQSIPFGGLAEPESIAECIVFLASPRARWVTGQCLVVDGGQSGGLSVVKQSETVE